MHSAVVSGVPAGLQFSNYVGTINFAIVGNRVQRYFKWDGGKKLGLLLENRSGVELPGWWEKTGDTCLVLLSGVVASVNLCVQDTGTAASSGPRQASPEYVLSVSVQDKTLRTSATM